ncbi:MAG: SH3 domain-containing protein [SAR324 cluster bacterium]|nr:SH3 domain-containing protein [SAR324 cluster bacterium]
MIPFKLSTPLIVTCLLVFSFAFSAQAESMYVRGFYAKILKNPADKKSKIMKVERGEEVSVLEAKTKWIKIDYQGTVGWMKAKKLVKEAPMKRVTLSRKETGLVGLSRQRFAKTQAMTTVRRLKADKEGDEKNAKVDFAALIKFEKSAPSSTKAIEFFNGAI